jgi:hypothetical protein
MLIDVPRFSMRTMPAEDRPGETEEVDASPIFASIGESRAGSLLVPVRNVGAGVGLGLAAAATFARDAVGNPVARGVAPSVLPAGELDAIRFADTPGPASVAAVTPLVELLQSGEDLVVEVAYSDVAGRQRSASSLSLRKSTMTDRDYSVTSVEHSHPPRLTAEWLPAALKG